MECKFINKYKIIIYVILALGWAHREMPKELKDFNISGLEIQMEVLLLTHIKTGIHSDSSNCTVLKLIQICMLLGTLGF
jgi:hypothetical protein